MIQNLQITYVTSPLGYRRTGVSYTDEQGDRRATQLNGFLHREEVLDSIVYHQGRVKAQIESGNYYT